MVCNEAIDERRVLLQLGFRAPEKQSGGHAESSEVVQGNEELDGLEDIFAAPDQPAEIRKSNWVDPYAGVEDSDSD